MLRLNLGSGQHPMREEGWINVDKEKSLFPDVLLDLEVTPWKELDSNFFGEIRANHVLEHLRNLTGVMQEIYRVAIPNALFTATVPHHAHDDFFTDPTHVTPITVETFGLFSKKNCKTFREGNFANTPLADILNVDFEVVSANNALDPYYAHWASDQTGVVQKLMRENRNVVKEITVVMKVIK